MATYSVLLLGQPLFRGPQSSVRVTGLKVQALLWYLAAQPERTFSRAHLAALLWEETSEADGRNSLSTTLSRLRQALPVWPLQSTSDSVGWDPRADVWVDAARFEDLSRSGDAGAATALWRGPFLDGFEVPASEGYAQWLEQERPHREALVLDLLSRQVAEAEKARDWQALAAHARRALGVDSLREPFHRALMLALARMGDRAAALTQYGACKRLLEQELGVAPERATTALRDEIVAGSHGSAPPPPSPTASGVAPPAPPLAGREADLAWLTGALTRAAGGEGRVVVLCGEAGIGKSRLVEEMLWKARSPGATPFKSVMVGRCHASLQGLPYAPFVEALSAVLPDIDMSELAGQEQRRLFEGVARALAALPLPVLLVLEDLQWADEATLQMLAYLAHQPLLRQVALLATLRAGDEPEEVRWLLESFRRDGKAAWRDLTPLSPDGIQSLVRALCGRRHAPLEERLYAETRGNPLFAVEMLRAIQEREGLDRLTPEALREMPLPRTVQGVIHSRLGHLSREARSLAAAAAIFPGGVPAQVLQRVCGLPEDVLLTALDELIAAGMLRESADASPRITFSHDLIRRAVLARLSQTRQQYLHRSAFQALHGFGAQAEPLANHALKGGLWAEGVIWSEAAAEAALRVYAYASVCRFYAQALTCLGNLPPARERRQRAIDLRLKLGQVSLYFQPERLDDWLEPAAREAAGLGDEARLSRVWLAQAGARYIQGRLQSAQPLLEKLLPLARAAGEADLLAPCLSVLGQVLAARGDYEQAVRVLAEAIPLQERVDNYLEGVVLRNMLAGVLAYQGEFGRAEAILSAGLALNRASGDAAALASTLGFVTTVALMKGDWQAAAAAGREALERAVESDDLVHQYVSGVFLGPALARLGDVTGALAVQQRAIELAGRMSTRIVLGQAHGWLGETYLLAGRIPEARAVVQNGLQIALDEGARFDAALCTRVLGEVALAEGNGAEATTHFAEALRICGEIGHGPEAARCHARLGRCETARGLFIEMGMAWDLEQLVLGC
ncbi:MAG TPA: tetratricopeptide repeat protein [Symbiobacteriaceae bacterium]|jgi:DNA-binding SARP family transcriptional activator/tetratricopeptide (TPR) repeat protein